MSKKERLRRMLDDQIFLPIADKHGVLPTSTAWIENRGFLSGAMISDGLESGDLKWGDGFGDSWDWEDEP